MRSPRDRRRSENGGTPMSTGRPAPGHQGFPQDADSVPSPDRASANALDDGAVRRLAPSVTGERTPRPLVRVYARATEAWPMLREAHRAAGAFDPCLTFLVAWLFKLWERRWHAHPRDRDETGDSSQPHATFSTR